MTQAEEVAARHPENDSENEAGVEQLTQLLLDQGKSAEAVALLEGITSKSFSPTLWTALVMLTPKSKNLPKAEAAYRKAQDLGPSELSHQRGLGQTLLAEEKYPEALKVYQKL